MAENNVVVRRKSGELEKGSTVDFLPNKEKFHLHLESGEVSALVVEDLKAVFFVKDLEGRPDRPACYGDDIPGGGKKVQVTFKDGEVVIGFTTSYSPQRRGFFLLPADKESNNLRVFVVASAVESIRMID